LKTGRAPDRRAAARALGKIGPVTEEVLPALHSALEHPDLGLRYIAATALGEMGPAAKDSVKHLIAADAAAKPINNRPGWQVRWGVMVAMGRIREPLSETIPFLLDTLQQPVVGGDDSTVGFAAKALVEIGAPAAEALPVLRRLAQANRDNTLGSMFRSQEFNLELEIRRAARAGELFDSRKSR
jgi:HEAT repeat protein